MERMFKGRGGGDWVLFEHVAVHVFFDLLHECVCILAYSDSGLMYAYMGHAISYLGHAISYLGRVILYLGRRWKYILWVNTITYTMMDCTITCRTRPWFGSILHVITNNPCVEMIGKYA